MGRRSYYNGNATYIHAELNKKQFDEMVKLFPAFSGYENDFDYNKIVKIPIRNLQVDMLEALVRIYKSTDDSKSSQVMAGYLKVMLHPHTTVIKELKKAEPAIAAWLRDGIIRGWVFNIKTGFPELVRDVHYWPSRGTGDDYIPAGVRVSTVYCYGNDQHSGGFTFHAENIRSRDGTDNNKTVERLFAEHGYEHETPELHAAHDKIEDKFLKYRFQTGLQFVHNGEKVVNDYDPKRNKNDDVDIRAQNALLILDDGSGDIDEEKVSRVPIHPYISCFNLAHHRSYSIPVTELTPYTYNPALREMLVLPDDHKSLIDALVGDLEIISDDIIEGKSGGTTILLQGRPGTGKTLSAEVYSEAVQKPLYRVHSGQLGLDAKDMEETLEDVMKRATLLNAILLIDEADVYLMQRGEDLERNAVVGVVLRVLEYYKGVLFLTTNRVDAIDDAIISRCIAVIRYENPKVPEREKIWATQFSLAGVANVDPALITKLAQTWDCSGRDIKGLVRLTTRYCRAHKHEPTFADFQRMAMFRGLVDDPFYRSE
jgi:hypothetical protein